jgi:hypothetical protein
MLVKTQHMFSVLDTHVMYVRQHICRPVISPKAVPEERLRLLLCRPDT